MNLARLLLSAAALPLLASAQTASPPVGPSTKPDEPIVLNPFVVPSERGVGYGAVNSNSITGFNVALAELPLSADIFNEQFMKDLGIESVEDVLKFSAGSGYAGADPANTAGYQPGDIASNAWITIRGLNTPVMTRDGLMPLGAYGNTGSTGTGFSSNFDLERVEVIEGPQGLLYGGGGAGGVINNVSKQAHLGGATTGEASMTFDQFGTKLGTLDYGTSTQHVALRFSLIDGTTRYNRFAVGGPLTGYYGQIAVQVANTTFRFTGERTDYRRTANATAGYSGDNAPGAPFDRNGYAVHYLIAEHMTGANDPTTGAAYPSGPIDNGYLNLANADSYSGWWAGAKTQDAFVSGIADSRWASWLSTRVSAGYNNYHDERPYANGTIYSPFSASNPLTGTWAEGLNPAVTNSPIRTKALRVQALVENALFHDHAQSKTLIGADYIRTDANQDTFAWYLADSNWNPVLNSTGVRTAMPTQFFSIAQGPNFTPVFNPYNTRVSAGGQNYVRMINNQVNPALISPLDPLGVTLGGSTYQQTKLINQGYYMVNDTDWFDKKLNSIVGVRFAKSYEEQLYAGSALSTYNTSPHDVELSQSHVASFNFGLNYHLLPNLSVYGEFSNNYQPPPVSANDPYGAQPRISHGVGEEFGLKYATRDETVSATLAFYGDNSKNEEYLMNGTLLNDISPKGVSTSNAHANGGNQWIPVDKTSQGVQLTLTAQPTSHWRMRLSAAFNQGTIHSLVKYQELYDDSFYTNPAGQVTYADGAVVWVPTVPIAKAPTVAPGTANAAPLTLANIADPTSPYYAFTPGTVPVAVQVTNSNLLNVLRFTSPTDGAIATGIGGIPYQQAQILPAFGAGGFTVPGTITVFKPGDKVAGPEVSFNFTSLYSFGDGWLKGVHVGGFVTAARRTVGYYYFPQGVKPGAPRTLFWMPPSTTLNGIVGYSRKFKRVTWEIQGNVNNVFNHYETILLPAENSGFAVPSALNAALFGQPRTYRVSTRLDF